MDECLICGVPGCCATNHEIDAIEAALDNPWLLPSEQIDLEDALVEAKSTHSIEQFAAYIDAND